MSSLKNDTPAGRTVMTVFATGVWLSVCCYKTGNLMLIPIPMTVALGLIITIAWHLESLNNLMSRWSKGADIYEFTLYSAFIVLVTAQSVYLAEPNNAFWLGVPVTLTLGIIPQIASNKNRRISIAISLVIYLIVLYLWGHLPWFTRYDIGYAYLGLSVTAFSKSIAEKFLQITMSCFGAPQVALRRVKLACHKAARGIKRAKDKMANLFD